MRKEEAGTGVRLRCGGGEPTGLRRVLQALPGGTSRLVPEGLLPIRRVSQTLPGEATGCRSTL